MDDKGRDVEVDVDVEVDEGSSSEIYPWSRSSEERRQDRSTRTIYRIWHHIEVSAKVPG